MAPTMQPEIICKMPVAEKFVPESTTTEVREYSETSYEETFDNRIICKFQPAAKLRKEFDCEYPTVDPNVTRVRDPLPFPDTLREVIAWTDAFVDRIAIMTAAEMKAASGMVSTLQNEIQDLKDCLNVTRKELAEAQDEEIKAKAANEKTERDLKEAKALAKAREATIADMNTKHAAETKKLQDENCKLTSQISMDQKVIEDLEAKLKEANEDLLEEHNLWKKAEDHHKQDHKGLQEATRKLQAETQLKKEAETKLAKAIEDNKVLEKKVKTADKKAESLGNDLAKAKETLRIKDSKLDKADKKVKALEKQVKDHDKKMKDANNETNAAKAALAAAQADLKKQEEEHKKEIKTLNGELEVANKEIETQKGYVADKHAAMENAIEEEAASFRARQEAIKARDDAKAKLEAEQDEVRRLGREVTRLEKELEKEKANDEKERKAYRGGNPVVKRGE